MKTFSETMRIAVVGGGLSGLSAAHGLSTLLRGKGINHELSLFEADKRTGGKIKSEAVSGFLCEWSTNGFLDSKPQTGLLCKSLGLENALLRSEDAARKRFIYAHGALCALPETPKTFFGSALLSTRGKLRLCMEPLIGKRSSAGDETIKAFAERRLGREAYAYLLDPMVSGVFAGNPDVMSLQSAFPRIHELEQTYGSLVKAMISLGRQKRKERKEQGQPAAAKAGPAGPGGVLTSFSDGAETLTKALTTSLGGIVHVEHTLLALHRRADQRYTLTFSDGNGTISQDWCDYLVFAIPAYALAQALTALDPEIGALAGRIPYSQVSVIHLGYDQQDALTVPSGFGFLVPSCQGHSILGTLFSSQIFQHRAPADKALLTVMIGGARRPDLAQLPDHELIALARRELGVLLNLRAKPMFTKVVRHPKAIPHYLQGHRANLEQMEGLLAQRWPGLYLTGNAFRGIGMNDCVASSDLICERFAAMF